MNSKSDANPIKPVHQFNRLYAYFFLMTATLLVVTTPAFLGTETHLFVYAFGGIVLVVFVKMFSAGSALKASQKRLFESGDYYDEAINRGIRYGWVATFLLMALLMALEKSVDLVLSGQVITRLSLATLMGIPSAAYLLLTRDDHHEREV